MSDQKFWSVNPDGILEVTINRPDQRNAMTKGCGRSDSGGYGQARCGKLSLRCAILTGAGGTFCAGHGPQRVFSRASFQSMRGDRGFGGLTTWTPKKARHRGS